MTGTKAANQWPSSRCAKAFWGQQDCAPYQRLLSDTIDLAEPSAGEHWLDLGCGGGAVSRAIWERSGGTVASIIALDCAAANREAYRKLCESIGSDADERIRFVHHDFSAGLKLIRDDSFDHAVSGLSISYAESFDELTGRWTTTAYDRLLAEVCRVIRPGGRFVFSVNVPNPSWMKVAWYSVPGMFNGRHNLRSLKKAARMLWYGRWLKREARSGRFHYLPAEEVKSRLTTVGFDSVAYRLSYCDQAYIFRATKPIETRNPRAR